MIIGVPKEIKDSERRVSLIPSGAQVLVGDGHEVVVEACAGVGSGFEDEEYKKAGAVICNTDAVWSEADLILKVKEPTEDEPELLREGQMLFTYLHLAASKDLTLRLMKSGATCYAYENLKDRLSYPLLAPMSQIAGRLAVQVGAYYLTEPTIGKGILMGGIAGVQPARVTILGAGTCGTHAAEVALGMGAQVTVLDIKSNAVERLRWFTQGRALTLISNQSILQELLPQTDLLISTVLIPGAKTPKIITRKMIRSMPMSVFVDVAIDQGGSSETSQPTTHSEPTYLEGKVRHYCVTNMPGAVPRTSTLALTNATLPYIREMAKRGSQAHLDNTLRSALSICEGRCLCDEVIEAHDLED